MRIPENIKAIIIDTEGDDNHEDVDVSLPGAIVLTVQHEKPTTISVDDIRRQVIETIETKPIGCDKKVYVIPHAELMTPNAQNALLKTLEEPPEYARIVLITTNKEMLLETIRSRCITLRRSVTHDLSDEVFTLDNRIAELFNYKIDSNRAAEIVQQIAEESDAESFMNGVRKYILENFKKLDPVRAEKALAALDKADSRLRFNVNTELTLEMMLMEI